MALIKCEECGHMVSDKANECPKCGYPLHSSEVADETVVKATAKRKSHKNRNIVILTCVLLVIAMGCGAWLYLSKGREIKVEMTDSTVSATADEEQTLQRLLPRPSLTDLELTGFDGRVKEMILHPEYELVWFYYFNEQRMLISCEGGEEEMRYHFSENKLVSSSGKIYREDFITDDDPDFDIVNYIYNYEGADNRHDIVYRTNTQTSQKRKFADVYYDEKGRIKKISRINPFRGSEEIKQIFYDDKNNPCDEEGQHIMIGAALIGFPDIQKSNCKKSSYPHNDNRGHYDDIKNFASLEIVYWQ